MRIWYDIIGTQHLRIAALPQPALESFAIGCIDHAYSQLYTSFDERFARDSEKVKVADQALDLLWKSREKRISEQYLLEAINLVSAIVPGTDSPDEGIEGWGHTLTAIYSALYCLLGERPVFWATNCSESSFLAIQERAANKFMAKYSTHLDQCNETQFEQEFPAPLREAEFQLQCLELCEQGISIVRRVRR